MSLVRAATAGELVKLRSNDQWSKLYVAIHKPAVVMSARVNQSFTTTDDVTQIIFDTSSPLNSYLNVIGGMTLYVGTTAGAYDLGMVRIRKAATSTVLYIGRTSDIKWSDDLYLTVVDEFSLWQKHWLVDSETAVYMDYDIPYGNQNILFDPIPVLGPDAVLWLTGATVVFSPTAADSWVFDSTITGYSWAAPGASATANLTTATPTITYNTTGQYRISCTVTAANGKTFTGYRTVFVFSTSSMPLLAVVDNCTGDYDAGGWAFTLSAYENSALSDIRDGTKVILFARDFYNAAEGSIGPQTGYENIICSGWIDGESIDYNAEQGRIRFTAKGPQSRLNTEMTFPGGLRQSSEFSWLYTAALTADKAIMNILHWHSTFTAIADYYKSGDTRQAAGFTPPLGTLWNQITYIANRLVAKPVCNRYGQFIMQPDLQVLPIASRSTIPIVMSVAKGDWDNNGINIERRIIPQTSMIEISGTGDTEAEIYFSRAPGKIFKRFGKQETRDQLLLADQTDANLTAKLLYAQSNNVYPNVNIDLAMNNRLIDICPYQYIDLSIASTDTVRGITWTNKKLIPRKVTYKFSPVDNSIITAVECEAETTGDMDPEGQTVIPPTLGRINVPSTPPLPDFPTTPYGSPWYPVPPPVIPQDPGVPDTGACPLDTPPNGPFGMYMSGVLVNNRTMSLFGMMGRPVYISRSASADYLTTVVLNCLFEELTDKWNEVSGSGWVEAYLINPAGTRVVQGTITGSGRQRTIEFAPITNIQFSAFELIFNSSYYPAALTASSVVNDAAFTFHNPFENPTVVSDVRTLVNDSDGALHWTADVSWTSAYPFDGYYYKTSFNPPAGFFTQNGGNNQPVEVYGRITTQAGQVNAVGIGVYGGLYYNDSGILVDFTPGIKGASAYFPGYAADTTVDLTRAPYTSHKGVGYSLGFEVAVGTTHSVQTLTTHTEMWIRQVSSKRVTVTSAAIYNLCTV
jgi:hypothetical protein